jgi:hypothetical protein
LCPPNTVYQEFPVTNSKNSNIIPSDLRKPLLSVEIEKITVVLIVQIFITLEFR